jgi:hypothetical protein
MPPELINRGLATPRDPSGPPESPLTSLRFHLLQLPLQRLPKLKHPIFHPRTHTNPRLNPLRPILPSLISILFSHLNPTPPRPRLRLDLNGTPPLRAHQHRLFSLMTDIIRINRGLQLRFSLDGCMASCGRGTRRLREHQAHRYIRRVQRDARNPAPWRERARKKRRSAIILGSSRGVDADSEGLRQRSI